MPAYIDQIDERTNYYWPESGIKELHGFISIPNQIGEPYEGVYEITPNDDFQMLPTSGAYLEDDILIYPIPYSEVSNLNGGYTATIGG